jgi:hypothetical protein
MMALLSLLILIEKKRYIISSIFIFSTKFEQKVFLLELFYPLLQWPVSLDHTLLQNIFRSCPIWK